MDKAFIAKYFLSGADNRYLPEIPDTAGERYNRSKKISGRINSAACFVRGKDCFKAFQP
jgi:hypothetical protein